MTTQAQQLSDGGETIWLDGRSPSRLTTGTLRSFIEAKNLVGVTTLTSSDGDITSGPDYDATGAAQQALEQHLPTLVADRVATRIFAKDHTLWGPDAEAESAVRRGWVEAATVSQALVPGIL
jgi:glucose-6-phosphate isomerase